MTSTDTLPSKMPRILVLRGEAVILDDDLAGLYGVATRVLNQAVKRNSARFPEDFAFCLTAEEWKVVRSQLAAKSTQNLRSQIVTSSTHGGRRHPPLAFTEHGAIMAASVLNSERAVAMSVYIVRAFVRMRRELLGNATMEARLQRIEKDLLTHDAALRDLYAKIKPLLLPPPVPSKPEIGFHAVPKPLLSIGKSKKLQRNPQVNDRKAPSGTTADFVSAFDRARLR